MGGARGLISITKGLRAGFRAWGERGILKRSCSLSLGGAWAAVVRMRADVLTYVMGGRDDDVYGRITAEMPRYISTCRRLEIYTCVNAINSLLHTYVRKSYQVVRCPRENKFLHIV